jgi:hypothetical protein
MAALSRDLKCSRTIVRISHALHLGVSEKSTQRPAKWIIPAFIQLHSMFARAGFVECARPSRSKVIMRCEVE